MIVKVTVPPLNVPVATETPFDNSVTVSRLAGFPVPDTARLKLVIVTLLELGFVNWTWRTVTPVAPGIWVVGAEATGLAWTTTIVLVLVGVAVGVAVNVQVGVEVKVLVAVDVCVGVLVEVLVGVLVGV